MPDFYDDLGQHRQLNDTEYEAALREKLQEEVNEYLESGEVMELADILEVAYALAALDGLTSGELDALRLEKQRERGSFSQRLWWDESNQKAE